MTTRNLLAKGALLSGAIGLTMLAAGAITSSTAGGSVTATPVPSAAPVVADANGQDSTGSEAAQSRNAARSRMRECGHQWSAMKKNGSAAGMTWKEFSQGCLAKP